MTQQERFEAWATSQGINITDNGFGGYDSQWTEGAFAGWEAAQAQAASTKDFSNLTNQAHGYSDVVSLGGMDPRNYAAANGVRQAAVKPVAYLTETEQGPMVWTPDMYGEACTYCDDGEFPVPLYTSPPDYRNAMKAALEALNSCTPGDWSTGHVIDPYHDEKLVDAAIAALEEELGENTAIDTDIGWHPV
jgi:hypothetical protein